MNEAIGIKKEWIERSSRLSRSFGASLRVSKKNELKATSYVDNYLLPSIRQYQKRMNWKCSMVERVVWVFTWCIKREWIESNAAYLSY